MSVDFIWIWINQDQVGIDEKTSCAVVISHAKDAAHGRKSYYGQMKARLNFGSILAMNTAFIG